ncbi:lysostaphin resistance A-like protein [Proteinivorax hydrogeniformans]|uniref:Lysostaphin resistance A-like protein n=1 Tax=Proteinivorax hydrogeniformans TaxID=1826727 RepID=A0AAU8HTZ8_9FIRM
MKSAVKEIYNNPVGKTFIYLLFAVVFGISALIYFISFSDNLGRTSFDYRVRTTYSFDDWVINLDYLTVDFKDGGYVVPGYQNDRVATLLIIGDGKLTLHSPDSFSKASEIAFPVKDRVTEMLIPVHHEDYDRLKRDTIFFEEETLPFPDSYIQDRIDDSHSLLYQGNILGFNKIIPPTEMAKIAELTTETYGTARYMEDKYVTFKSGQLGEIRFKHPFRTQSYPPPNVNIAMAGYSILLLAAFWGLVGFLTTDITNKKTNLPFYLDKIPTAVSLVAISLTTYLSYWLYIYYNLSPYLLAILYLIPLIYIAYTMVMAKVPISFLGITLTNIYKSLILALVIFYIWFVVTSLEIIPRLENFTYFEDIFIICVLVSIKQLIFRGFIQASLDSIIGGLGAVVITSLLILPFPVISFYYSSLNTDVFTFILSSFCLVLLISFSQHKTKNIITPTILSTLIAAITGTFF